MKILGAGISGLSAAINLAKKGYSVDVYDRARDSGQRFSGDFQGLENWSSDTDVIEELKRSNIRINFDCDPFSSMGVSDGTDYFDLKSEKPIFYLVKRGTARESIDQGMKRQALEAGVRIHFDARESERKVDIVATGPNPKNILRSVDKGIIFSTRMKDTVVALVNDKMAYKGYSYLMVKSGYGCICTVVMDKTNLIGSCFDNTLQFFRSRFGVSISNAHTATGIIGFSLNHAFQEGNARYVGEAAGLQEILWGFGMRSAIGSGYLAARSIIENKDYQKLAAEKFANYMRASVVNRYIWEKAGEDDYSPAIKKLAKAKDIRRLMRQQYRFTAMHRMMFPVAYSKVRATYPTISRSF
ncbi:MAG: NAD(P)-binding protein [Candidatus Micrarchaeota archaeon]|nr:NAD(P)-binding protein [Candidatus Micrarchaeota archaeon]